MQIQKNTRTDIGSGTSGEEQDPHVPRSIRSAIQSVVTISILMLILVYLVMMGLNYHALYTMKKTIDNTMAFGEYYDAYDLLDSALDTFMRNPGEENTLSCQTAMNHLEETSSVMAKTFPDPRYVDNDYLTKALGDQVRGLLERFHAMTSEEQIASYNTCDKILGYIDANKAFLSVRRTQIIQDDCSKQFSVWRIHFILLLLILLLFALFLAFFASDILHRILDPILELTQKARDFHEGIQNGAPRMSPGAKPLEGREDLLPSSKGRELWLRETQILNQAFDSMAQTISKQVEELQDKILLDQEVHQLQLQNIQMQLSLAEANMQLLQSMISPHFLFNCLSTLSGTAYLEHAPRTRDISLKMAVFLRESLTLVGQTIPLEREVEHTKKYIEIQQLRFGDRIHFFFHVPEDCYGIPLPAMLLQPLIENAISHGVKDLWKDAQISIFAQRRENLCIIQVVDNGRGISEEELDKIQQEIEVPFEPGKHTIGLHSVASRIRSAFPKEGSTSISSRPGEGVCIELHIPIPVP